MSKKVPCSKCGDEYTTQGIKNHETRCDGTPKAKKTEPITFSEPIKEPVQEGHYFTKEPEDKPEHRIDEQRIVEKHDLGSGVVIALLVILAIIGIVLWKGTGFFSGILSRITENKPETEPAQEPATPDLRGIIHL